VRAAAFLLLAALVGGCGEVADARPGTLRVVATTGMVADLARVIGGDEVEVIALMGPGVDPHVYKASALDLDRLRGARLILFNGLGLEGRMGDLFVKLAHKQAVVAVTESVDPARLLEPPELEGHFDPHLWFDVGLWAETTTVVAEALAELAPAHAALFRSRAHAYRQELRALHEEVKRELATIPARRRVLLTSHDAFRYFGRAYDLEVRGLQGISTVDDPGVKDIQEMAELIGKRGIKALFVESSVSPKAIQAVHEWVRREGFDIKIGGTLFSDAMGDAPPTDTYIGMVRANTRTIVEALR
jgi:manganese/zinc/iron transport system substrate-binding protein